MQNSDINKTARTLYSQKLYKTNYDTFVFECDGHIN
jgi:hypothetical protein